MHQQKPSAQQISFTNLWYQDAMHDFPAISSLNWSSETWHGLAAKISGQFPVPKGRNGREKLAYLRMKPSKNVCNTLPKFHVLHLNLGRVSMRK